MNTNPQIIENNREKFVMIPYEEFLKIQGQLDHYDGLRSIREAREVESETPSLELEEAKQQLGIE